MKKRLRFVIRVAGAMKMFSMYLVENIRSANKTKFQKREIEIIMTVSIVASYAAIGALVGYFVSSLSFVISTIIGAVVGSVMMLLMFGMTLV